MVAPYEVGDPVRSYVRVPGSGTDKAAKSLCCDLSRVSSVAAAAPIPASHVQEPQPPTVEDLPSGQERIAAESRSENEVPQTGKTKSESKKEVSQIEITQSESLVSSRPNEGEIASQPNQGQTTSISNHDDKQQEQGNKTTSNPRKRSSTEVDDVKCGTVEPPKKHARVASSGEISSITNDNVGSSGSVGINTVICGSCSSSVGTQTTEALNKVLTENTQLKKQNELLNRRLSVFKDIFKNRNRLAKLLRALEVEQAA